MLEHSRCAAVARMLTAGCWLVLRYSSLASTRQVQAPDVSWLLLRHNGVSDAADAGVGSTLAMCAFFDSSSSSWTPRSITPGSVNEDQLQLGRQRRLVHSISRWTWGVQVKLWDPLRTHAIPEHLRGVFTARHYTNPRLPYHNLPYIDSGVGKWVPASAGKAKAGMIQFVDG